MSAATWERGIYLASPINRGQVRRILLQEAFLRGAERCTWNEDRGMFSSRFYISAPPDVHDKVWKWATLEARENAE